MDPAKYILLYLACLKLTYSNIVNESYETGIITNFTLISTVLNNITGLRFSRESEKKCSILQVPIKNKKRQLCVWKEKFSDYDIASSKTKIYLSNGALDPREIFLSDLDLYLVYGYVVSDPNTSLIKGYIQNGRLFGAVHMGSETYYIEPIYKFPSIMKKMKVSNHNVSVMYKAKNVYLGEDGFDSTLINMSPAFILHYRTASHHKKPTRTPPARLCSVSVTADYTLYNELHSKNVKDTVTHLLLIISEVNLLMRNAKLNSKQSGNIGIKIERIIIEITSNSSLSQNFSRCEEFLKHFSKGFHVGVCLSMLFTFRNFGDGALGASWTGNPDINQLGGICEKPIFWKHPDDTPSMSFFNTLLICLKTSYGDATPFLMSVLNTAHEIGHSFGSFHDNRIDVSKAYIMSPFSLSGGYTSNLYYSEESLKNMSTMIHKKGDCLEKTKDSYCGNELLEEGEECNCGIPSECLTRDPCCMPRGSGRLSCRVRRSAGYKCHPSQGLCCLSNCQYRDLTKFQLNCEDEKITCPCKDNDLNCSCGLLGRCIDDQCHSLECTRLGLQECICSPSTDKYCITCCISSDQKCVPATILTAELLKSGNINLDTLSNYEKNDNWTHSSVLVKQYCVGGEVFEHYV